MFELKLTLKEIKSLKEALDVALTYNPDRIVGTRSDDWDRVSERISEALGERDGWSA